MAKARTKAEKIRQKRERGRPRMEGPREPSGRLSRSGIDHEPADVVAINARIRHYGILPKDATDQKAGTFIGYLNLIGPVDGISDDQYNGANEFLELRAAYLRALKAPNNELDNGAVGSSGDEVSEAYEDWARGVIQRYTDCRKLIYEAQAENRTENLWGALDLCIIRSERHYHLIGATRIVCNALARFFRG